MVKLFDFLNVSVFNARSTALVWLNMVQTGHAGPTDHSGCSPGHSGHFGGSHVTCHDNTKLRKFSKIGLWSYFGARFQYEGVVCQSGTKGR
jgi:hypothetical protein